MTADAVVPHANTAGRWSYEAAVAAAFAGTLPPDFSQWELADESGWTVAHVAAEAGTLPPNGEREPAASAAGGIDPDPMRTRHRLLGCRIVIVVDAYQRSDGAVYSIGLHVIWCPKYRKAVLTGPLALRLKKILAEVAGEHGWRIEALEVMPDHVHVFVYVGPNDSVAAVTRAFKGRSSRILRAEFTRLRSWYPGLWSGSYFASSVGRVSADTVRRYIECQTARPLAVGR